MIERMMQGMKHLAPFVRRHPLLPPVESIGYFSQKKSNVNITFTTCNFSFILSGNGTYRWHGEEFAVIAPCVILQCPGEPMFYGPPEGGCWEELYLIYPPEAQTELCRAAVFLPGDPPVRPLQRNSRFEGALENVKKICLTSDCSGSVFGDMADLYCWELIFASFIQEEEPSVENQTLQMLCKRLEKKPGEEIRLEDLAKEMGMSVSTLRRYWHNFYGNSTFRDYRDSVFLRESCRMLVETKLKMKEIAAELGFQDSFYFSRKFHEKTGITASEYRIRHRIYH